MGATGRSQLVHRKRGWGWGLGVGGWGLGIGGGGIGGWRDWGIGDGTDRDRGRVRWRSGKAVLTLQRANAQPRIPILLTPHTRHGRSRSAAVPVVPALAILRRIVLSPGWRLARVWRALSMVDHRDLKLGLTSGLIGVAGMLLILSLGSSAQGMPGGGHGGHGGHGGGGAESGGTGGGEAPAPRHAQADRRRPRLPRADGPRRPPGLRAAPDLGFGHYSGNVAPYLGADGKPVFSGEGNKVTRVARLGGPADLLGCSTTRTRGDIAGAGGVRTAAASSRPRASPSGSTTCRA